jgi:DNA-binding NtrC family response regulator
MAARFVHDHSRRKGPFVAVNCGALPATLVEAELFGHEKGAFTGATGSRPGRIRQANGGTLFLDEIGDMPLEAQVRLLRTLEERVVEPLGSDRAVEVDIRVVAATHRDLRQLVTEGRFREDLFYRLDVLSVQIPPLRERPGDVLLLARRFLDHYGGKRRLEFSPSAESMLSRWSWPGNVRELRNAMERAVLLSRGELLLPDHLPARVLEPGKSAAVVEPTDLERLEEIERQAIFQTLRQHNANRTETARALGISRRTLIYKLQRFRQQGFNEDA